MSVPQSTITFSANTSWYLYNFRSSTIKAFLNEGHQVVCLSPKDKYSVKLSNLGCKWIPLKIDNKGTNPVKDFILFIKMFLLYRKLRPKIAFHFTIKNNIYGTFAAYLSKVRSINNVTGLGTAFIKNNFTSYIVRFLYKLSQPLAHRIYCQNEEDFEYLLAEKLTPKDSLRLLPGSGVDLHKFHPNTRILNNDKNKKFHFLFAGRIIADKGVLELIEAFKSIDQKSFKCDLWMCGFLDSVNRSSISLDQFEEWKSFEWFNWLGPIESMETVMAKVDCLVLPSYREGMPRSILEACAMEIPVITTNVPGCRNVVSNKINGLICNPKDAHSLQNALEQMMNMSLDSRKLLGVNGRLLVKEKYDERFVIQAALDELALMNLNQ
jgi:glycosyltransferase involved in cell wall biosynthesis